MGQQVFTMNRDTKERLQVSKKIENTLLGFRQVYLNSTSLSRVHSRVPSYSLFRSLFCIQLQNL